MIIEFIASVTFNILSMAFPLSALYHNNQIKLSDKKCKILMTFQNTLSIPSFNNEIKSLVKIIMSCFM